MATKTKRTTKRTTTNRQAKKAATTKAPTKAEQKAQEQTKLARSEANLVERYGDKIVPGTVRNGTGRYQGKFTVEIRTRGLNGEFDGNTRRIATSDVHQVSHTVEVKTELDRMRKQEKSAARREQVSA